MHRLNRTVAILFGLLISISTGTLPAQQPELAQQMPPAALTALKAAAEAGSSDAQFQLGTRYLYGEGVEQNNFTAAEWLRKSAGQGNHNAQYNMGVMSLNGLGMIADTQEAIHWFTRAAENADTAAQFTLGVMYANGRGVLQDMMQAHMWFSLAAAGGNKNAAVNAVLFQEMLSPEQLAESQSTAREWIEKFRQQMAQ